jgi:arylsulfatase A-like enzyme
MNLPQAAPATSTLGPLPTALYNLIVITSDELRADCLGFMGSPDVKTPALDAFAQRGVVFNNHFCNFPKCVPSRISLFTGRRPHTGGYRDIFQHLPPDAPDLKRWAQTMGYETVLLGKSHCWQGQKFDDFVDLHSWSPAMMPFWHKREPQTITYKDYGYTEVADSGLIGLCRGQDNDEIYVDQACHYLTAKRGFSRPFMMVLNLEKPHPGYEVSEPYYSQYDRARITQFPRELPRNAPLSLRAQYEVRGKGLCDENLRDMQAVYFGMISKIDALLARFFDTISSQDLWKHTIVLFVSDHGDWASQFCLNEKWDTSFNDCMTRVPCVLYAPNLPGGQRVSGLSEMIDIAPTLLGLLGTSPTWPVHGMDLRPVIDGAASKTAVFCDGGHEPAARARFRAMHGECPVRHKGVLRAKQETYRLYPEAMARARMIRTDHYKMVIRETGDHELYDMVADPWELDNRWGDPTLAAVVHDLQLQMLIENLRTDPDTPPLVEVGA